MARHERSMTSFDDQSPSLSEASESSLLEKSDLERNIPNRKLFYQLLVAINVIGFVLSASMLGIGLHWQMGVNQKCLQLHSSYSPALRNIDSRYRPTLFNGSLNYPSIYRGNPSPEIDAAWDELDHVNVMSIAEEDLLKVGKTTDAVKIPSQFGGGYMASLEVNHQLHCINFLRKSLSPAYYTPPSPHTSIEFIDPPAMLHVHQRHCLEMLRQFVMCHADVGLVTYKFVKNHARPYPDFNTWHQCRDFRGVLQWAQDNQLKAENGGPPDGWAYVPGEGDMVFDMPP